MLKKLLNSVVKFFFKKHLKSDPIIHSLGYSNSSVLAELTQKIRNIEELTPEEDKLYMQLRLEELPDWVVAESVFWLRKLFSHDFILDAREKIDADPATWYAPYNSNWGRAIRNYLREKVCTDHILPSPWGFDDYYVQLVEIAVGRRDDPTIKSF
jgi:hypothetical protein